MWVPRRYQYPGFKLGRCWFRQPVVIKRLRVDTLRPGSLVVQCLVQPSSVEDTAGAEDALREAFAAESTTDAYTKTARYHTSSS